MQRHDEVERPVLGSEYTSNVFADAVEVRYLDASKTTREQLT